jgi:hypothetical protein
MPSQCCKDTWEKIPDDEPVFILRAKDELAPYVLGEWITNALEHGVNADKVEGAERHLEEFQAFQKANPDRVKLPD